MLRVFLKHSIGKRIPIKYIFNIFFKYYIELLNDMLKMLFVLKSFLSNGTVFVKIEFILSSNMI